MKISVIGTGYVGLVTGACFAELGNEVLCVDNDPKKIALLKRGKMPIYEPGLEEMVHRNRREGNLSFSTSIREAVGHGDVIFIAVGTPPREDGSADLSAVETVSKQIAKFMRRYRVIVQKSTVPAETGEWMMEIMRRYPRKKALFDIVSNPEFLREGTAVGDFLHPDRIVIGTSSPRARKIMETLYKPLKSPMLFTDIKSAELIKHASNSFLAVKISFINAVSFLCERVGADVTRVAEGMGYDKRIGRSFLDAGIGFGGICFPKDLSAFIWLAKKLGYDFELLRAVEKINQQQKERFVEKCRHALGSLQGKIIAVLGLSFKPNTDDMRCAPSIDIIRGFQEEGALIRAYDPAAIKKARPLFTNVVFCKDPYETVRRADALAILTDWDEFKGLDLKRLRGLMRGRLLLDGRNIYDPKVAEKAGMRYFGIGK